MNKIKLKQKMKKKESNPWLILWNNIDNSYMILSFMVLKNNIGMITYNDVVLEQLPEKLSFGEAMKIYVKIVKAHQELFSGVKRKNKTIRDNIVSNKKCKTWMILWNIKEDVYTLTNEENIKLLSISNDDIIEDIKGNLTINEAREIFYNRIKLNDKLSPLVIAKNTIVRNKMTLDEKRIADEVSTNWMEWIKNNCKLI